MKTTRPWCRTRPSGSEPVSLWTVTALPPRCRPESSRDSRCRLEIVTRAPSSARSFAVAPEPVISPMITTLFLTRTCLPSPFSLLSSHPVPTSLWPPGTGVQDLFGSAPYRNGMDRGSRTRAQSDDRLGGCSPDGIRVGHNEAVSIAKAQGLPTRIRCRDYRRHGLSTLTSLRRESDRFAGRAYQRATGGQPPLGIEQVVADLLGRARRAR
jgi:hypothetical protein